MEAIKCPNCGSEKVQELTEEKYVCLACDNVFLVHNLSKEFKRTDEHIDEVHQDINKKLDELKENYTGGASDVQIRYKNAFHLIEIGEYEQAEQAFGILCAQYSMNYQSWYGLILLATNNFSEEQSWDTLFGDEFWDIVAKMRKCEDYPQEVEERLSDFFNGFTGTDDLDYLREQIEDLRTMVSEQKTIKTINLTRWIVLALAECLTLWRTFAGIIKSIGVITAPLPDPASEEAGARLGSAVLNFFAIPVKGIIGIAVMYFIYIGIRFMYELVMENYWNQSEEKLAALNPNFREALEQVREWWGRGKRSQELLQMIKMETDNHIHFAEIVTQQINPEFMDGKQKKEESIELEKISSQKEIQNYNNLPEEEKKNRRIRALLPPIILLLIGMLILLGGMSLGVVLILISLIWAYKIWAVKGKTSEFNDDNSVVTNLRKEIDEEQQ